MLQLTQITKSYMAGDTLVQALRGVTVRFRPHEFVSILGPSGCGKTTLLNIIGGLDRYDSGDLVIAGRSTKQFSESDWDTYRNHSVGFIFQSYNLIPHQTVLANVELALTLAGVSKAERRQRAIRALQQVGLGDQLHKKPNQMSGGQMQRVAVARALVNDPEILLADEPTGALDSETSVALMETLKEISKDRLIVMVTHNPALAEQYSTRIIRMLDGKMQEDTAPYEAAEAMEALPDEAKHREKGKKTSMSFFTAFSLSLHNLMTKKGRTMLTSFAGSIGIIGIALILALSNGIHAYIDKVQEDTLSTYPISILAETMDMSSLLSMLSSSGKGEEHALDAVYSSHVMEEMFRTMMTAETSKNNLAALKKYIESKYSDMKLHVSSIQYGYDLTPQVYASDTTQGVYKVNPSAMFEELLSSIYSDEAYSSFSTFMKGNSSFANVWNEMMPGKDGELINPLLKEQYDLLAGHWPENEREIVLIVDQNHEIRDVYLYALGLKDPAEMKEMMAQIVAGKEVTFTTDRWDYQDIIGMTYRLVLACDYYQYDQVSGGYRDMQKNETYMSYLVGNGVELKISGIICPSDDAVATSMNGAIGYTSALTSYMIRETNQREIVRAQLADPLKDVRSGLPFDDGSHQTMTHAEKAAAFLAYVQTLSQLQKAELYEKIVQVPPEEWLDAQILQAMEAYPQRAEKEAFLLQLYEQAAGIDRDVVSSYLSGLSEEEIDEILKTALTKMIVEQYAAQKEEELASSTSEALAASLDSHLSTLSEKQLAELYELYMPDTVSDATYEEVLTLLGVADPDSPRSIALYAATFQDNDAIAKIIAEYNESVSEADRITYTDYVALLMSSVSTVINAISYVLIAFVGISLVVSSIMIGIITYISVLERTKEIGILRAIGASRRDVARVFNAETLIIGFCAGIIGIGFSLLLCVPINMIVWALTDIPNLRAVLPWEGALLLVVVSMLFTFVAGVIPSRIAAKKDPVIALRTE